MFASIKISNVSNAHIIFLDSFASQGVLNKDSAVWLDRAKPANQGIALPSTGNAHMLPCSAPTQESIFSIV